MPKPSKEDLLQHCYTMIKDLNNGWPISELHMSPELLLEEIEDVMPDVDKGEETED